MHYMLLIYTREAELEALAPEDRARVFQEYVDFTRSLRESGKLIAGQPLKGTSTATSVRIREGKTLVTDGPFAETREQLGGFYIVEAEHLDEALALAARLPAARDGTVEVRPIGAMPQGVA
jgi:hypothetical protein